MKKSKRLKKVPQYSFGANAILNWGTMSGVDRANSVLGGVGAVGSMIGNATSDQPVTFGSILTGAAGGAASGAAIGGVPGAIIGGGLGLITSSIGNGGSVNEQTGEVTMPSGISGLFGHSKNYLRLKSGRIKNGIQARQNSELIASDYYQNNGYNELSMANGGVVPNTTAYLDDGELLRTPDGTIGAIPEEGKPTDSNLLNVPVGTQVLSDKLKVPGTNKTFAEMGKKLMKRSNKKATDIYAQNSQKLNERNNQLAYQQLLEQLEALKSKKGIKKAGNKYSVGDDGVKPYGYNKNLNDFKYWDTKTNNYTPDYLNWVNNITDLDVKDIYSGKYGDMSTYLGKNKGYTPSVQEARQLMTDKKYGDWHKIGQAFVDNRSNSRETMPLTTKYGRNTQDFTRPSLASMATGSTAPGKFPTKYRPVVAPPTKDESGINGLIDNVAALAGPLGNIFAGKPERVDTYTYNPVYGPTNYNIDPMLREATLTDSISRYNMANINPNTGANMAYGLQSAVGRNRAIANAYSQKNNAENQMAFNNAQIANQWGQQYANARHIAAVEQAQNDAATRNIRRQGFGDMATRIQLINRDRRLTSRDSAMLDAMMPYLEYGMTSDQLTKLYNNLKRR